MELICNELSFLPLADNAHQLEERYKILVRAFKVSQEKYNFSHIRFPVNYGAQRVTATQTYYEWVSTLTNRTLQAVLLGLCKPPYYDELEQQELDAFFQSEYRITDDGVPIPDNPIGLPISYIKSLPAISIHSHDFWLRRKINMCKTDDPEGSAFFAYNICIDSDINSTELIEWVDNFMSLRIVDQSLLTKYLGFVRFRAIFSQDFFNQLMQWKEEDINTFKYTLLLMKDVEANPFTGGMGQTENLRNRGKEASKRINITDRLSYTVESNIVNFISCKGHYDFH